MGGALNHHHLLFLAQGALWDAGPVADRARRRRHRRFRGRAVPRLAEPGRAGRERRLCPADPGDAAPRHHVPRLFRPRGDRAEHLPPRGGRSLADHLCRGVSRRDLARRDPVRAAAAMGGGGGAGAQPDPAHVPGHPPSGHPDRDAADGRLHGPDHQEYLACLGGRIRRARRDRDRSSTILCSSPS